MSGRILEQALAKEPIHEITRKDTKMSDMLQLVVNIMDTQVMVLSVTCTLSLANPDDKLKHVGHFRVVSCYFVDRFGFYDH
jgi:hypothetical protein